MPRARIGILVIFGLVLAVDGYFFISLPVDKPVLSMPLLIASPLWTAALLIALWRRQHWARLILIGLCVVAAAAFSIMLVENGPLFTAYLIGTLVSIGCGAYLVYSRDMRRLTSRERE